MVGLFREILASTLRLDEAPYVVGAGRTDTGVHALAQVIHFDLPERVLPKDDPVRVRKILRGLNAQFQGRIQVTRATPVRSDFDARRSATWREYRYLVVPTRLPTLTLAQHWAWPVEGPLNVEAMNEAAARLVGEHDFRAFCRRAVDTSPDDPIVRKLMSASWCAYRDELELTVGRAPLVKFTIRAQSFCHRMVRSLTSTLVAVGRGALDVDEITTRLSNHRRDFLPPPAPAAGLALAGVGYADADGGTAGAYEEFAPRAIASIAP